MGGKHKQANRTKNNARPSSSSHSAELLGNTIPTFFGFSTVKDGIAVVSGLTADDASYNIHPSFQIIFKQMNKKDPTTRFKALQTFNELCNTSDVNAVKAILPLWARLYCTLCTDIDHKVRESAHRAHHAVVSKVKKMIAPYLKEISGPWFSSQYDTYAPAASAATLAFEEAFPSTKLNKAIVVCQEEILSYIFDNLINQTPQTLSNPNITSPTDMQAKYERIIIASLQCYNLYLQKLSSDEVQKSEESNKKLISNQKFWKYSKNKLAIIRSCFFHVLITLCQKAKFLLNGESSKLNSAIFNNLDESDPAVLHVVWDAALNVLVTIEDCWSHINIEKQVFAKLCLILKGGGRNILTIYPNILPLLSKLPEDMIKDKEVFYGNLFDNMRCGLEVNSYSQIKSEVKILTTTFIECLKYIVMRNSSDILFCTSLIANQLIPALEQKLSTSKAKKIVNGPFLTQTACLVHYWHSNISPQNPAYEKIIEVFFHSLFNSCTNQLNSEVIQNSLCEILNNQVEFMLILQNPNQYISKNKGGVKFEGDEQLEEVEVVNQEVENFEFSEKMLPLVKKMVVIYFKNAINNEDKSYIPAISKIVSSFESKIIFEELVVAVNESTSFKLFSSYFSKWLMNDDMKCGELVDLSFRLLKHVTHDEKEYILEEFCNNWFSDTLQLAVCKALPNYSTDFFIIKWVRSDRFSKSVLSSLERFIASNGNDLISRDIIILLLKAKCGNGEFVLDSTTAGEIISVVRRALEESDEKSHLIQLCHDLVLNTSTQQISGDCLQSLVASLFKLWCYISDNENLIDVCKISLKMALTNLQNQNMAFFKFTEKLSKVIREIIVSDKINFSLEQIVSNINAYVELAVNTILSDSYPSNLKTEKVMQIVKLFLKKEGDWNGEGMRMMEKCCRVGFEGCGDLNFKYLQQEQYLTVTECATSKWEKYPKFDMNLIKKYAKWNLYVGSVLNLIPTSIFLPGVNACTIEENEPDDFKSSLQASVLEDIPKKLSKGEDSKLKSDSEVIDTVFKEPEYAEENTIQPLLNNFFDFLLSVGFFESFIKYYTSTKYHHELIMSTTKLKSIAFDFLKNVNVVEFQTIYDHCVLSIRELSVWWLVKSTFEDVFKKNCIELTLDESNFVEEQLDDMKKIDIAKQPVRLGNYLKILTFVEMGLEHRFTEGQWDHIFIYVHNFFEVFLDNSDFLESELLTLSAVSRLYIKLKKRFTENHTKKEEERISSETCLAWNEVVQTEVYNKFLAVWRKLAKHCYSLVEIPPEWVIALQNLGEVVIDGLPLRKYENLKESVDLGIECGKIMTSHTVIQITSFRLCLSVIPDLVKVDTEIFGNHVTQMFQDTKEGSSLFKKSSNSDWTAKKLKEEILQNQGIVEILLSDFIVGDCCTVETFTDSFTYTYSYLLLWFFLLEMCGEAHSPLRFQYGCWLQDEGYSKTLLESLFKLMPQAVLHGSEAKENYQKYFENYVFLDFREPVKSELIEQMACFVYRLFLERLPNVVREWWNQSENKTSSLVEKVTKLYVSPILISNELKNVQQDRGTGFENMEVKTYPVPREVVATYTIDEVKMDLIMTLPQNYPLGIIKIESSNVVVSTSNWRNWLFHISKYLIHQNGTIWDALVIWKNNLDKKFEGVEECYICFSILQGSTFEIPRLCCHTCKKKFHSNCLYKWFSTRNISTCPICRNFF